MPRVSSYYSSLEFFTEIYYQISRDLIIHFICMSTWAFKFKLLSKISTVTVQSCSSMVFSCLIDSPLWLLGTNLDKIIGGAGALQSTWGDCVVPRIKSGILSLLLSPWPFISWGRGFCGKIGHIWQCSGRNAGNWFNQSQQSKCFISCTLCGSFRSLSKLKYSKSFPLIRISLVPLFNLSLPLTFYLKGNQKSPQHLQYQ